MDVEMAVRLVFMLGEAIPVSIGFSTSIALL